MTVMAAEELKGILEAMQLENASAHEKTRQHVDVTAAETRRQADVTAAETRQYVDAASSETRRHVDIVLERLDAKFDLLAESVTSINEGVYRLRISMDEKIESSAAETQAMIRFSHRELDRRVTSLENDVS